uniref:Heavy metal-binding protein HIP n=1 Tax=Magallana gigas TaxID=29159 RepID=K1R977_MAGGI
MHSDPLQNVVHGNRKVKPCHTKQGGGATGGKVLGDDVDMENIATTDAAGPGFVVYKTFVYDRVETNTGNGYDIKSGKFTAPESGHYVFHTSTTAYDKSYSIIEIVKNNKLVDVALADANDHNDRAAASTMTILSLAKGDTVLVRAGAYYSGYYLETSQYTRMSFSGFKLA